MGGWSALPEAASRRSGLPFRLALLRCRARLRLIDEQQARHTTAPPPARWPSGRAVSAHDEVLWLDLPAAQDGGEPQACGAI